MKARNFKRIWGNPWDYEYLLKLEQYKIREMSKAIAKTKRHEGWEIRVRELNLCDKLISIILEEDDVSKAYLHKFSNFEINTVRNDNGTYTLDTSNWITPTFDHYVNIRNIKRFGLDIRESLINHLKSDLRQVKALYLYNKIRSYKMFHWWY